MKTVLIAGMIVGGLTGVAGVSGLADAPTTPSVSMRPAATAPARDGFPLEGRWRWADAGALLPRSGIGCGAGEASLTLTGRTVSVERGAWRHQLFVISDWRLTDTGDLSLRLIGSGSPLLDRSRITLDLSSAGFARFRSASDDFGRPLTDRLSTIDPERRATAAAELAGLAGAFTLVRCDSPDLNTAALLRGTTTGSSTSWTRR